MPFESLKELESQIALLYDPLLLRHSDFSHMGRPGEVYCSNGFVGTDFFFELNVLRVNNPFYLCLSNPPLSYYLMHAKENNLGAMAMYLRFIVASQSTLLARRCTAS